MSSSTVAAASAPLDRINSVAGVAGLLDHSILHPTITEAQAAADLDAVAPWPIASVCIKPTLVPLAVARLAGRHAAVGTVVGFPHGSVTPAAKAFETRVAVEAGCSEIDMVVNVGAALGGEWSLVRDDIAAVVDAARANSAIVKVIFETDFLPNDDVKVRLCVAATEAGADFVKTSTGFGFVVGDDQRFGYVGATEHDIALMRRSCPPTVGVKASGGVRDLDAVLKMATLGATRVGVTRTLAILSAARQRFEGGGDAPEASGDGRGQLQY